jgi:hypothetical protein
VQSPGVPDSAAAVAAVVAVAARVAVAAFPLVFAEFAGMSADTSAGSWAWGSVPELMLVAFKAFVVADGAKPVPDVFVHEMEPEEANEQSPLMVTGT